MIGARAPAAPHINDPDRAGILFLDPNRLIIYAVEPDPSHLATRASAEFAGSHKLTVFIVDASSGRQLATKSWSTAFRHASVHVISSGILIQTGSLLQVESYDLKEVHNIELPPFNSGKTWIVSASASGRTVLVNRYDNQTSHFDRIDGGTLKVRASWEQSPPLRRLYSISDSRIAAADFNQQNILTADFGSPNWKTLAGKPQLKCVGMPTLINDILLAKACGGVVQLLSSNGQLIMQETAGKSEGFETKIAGAAEGNSIAVALERTKGTDFWDTGNIRTVERKILVYDLSAKRTSFTLNLDPLPKNIYDFGLSPDGSKLATITDDNVSVYSVDARYTK